MKTTSYGSVPTPRSLAEIVVQLAFRHYLDQNGFTSTALEASSGTPIIPELLPSEMKRFRNVRILDLGIGNGSFLLLTAANLEAIYAVVSPETEQEIASIRRDILVNNLWGIDNDPDAVHHCRQSLRDWIGYENGEITNYLSEKIMVGNALVGRTHEKDTQIQNFSDLVQKGNPQLFHWDENFPDLFSQEPQGFDIILCNPPYVTKNLAPETIRLYRSLYGQIFVNRFNLYHLFFARVKDLLAPHGVAVFLTANSVLTDQYSMKLRKFLGQSFTILSIFDFVSRTLFPKILQGVCIVVLQRKPETKRATSQLVTEVIRTFNESTYRKGNFDHSIIPTSHLVYQEKFIPNPNQKTNEILKFLQETCVPAKEFFSIQSGEIRPADSKIRPLYFKMIPQDDKGLIFDPILNGKNTSPFLINLTKTRPKSRWFLRPAAEDEHPIFRSQHALAERIVFQRITAREQLRRLVAARIDQNHLSLHPVWVENNLNYLRLPSPKRVFSADVLLGIFNSLLLNWFLHQINLTAAVPPSDLGLLPLPTQDGWDQSLESEIKKTVIEIKKQLATVDSLQKRLTSLCPICMGEPHIEQLRQTLDSLVFQLYQLPLSHQTIVTDQMTGLHNYFRHH